MAKKRATLELLDGQAIEKQISDVARSETLQDIKLFDAIRRVHKSEHDELLASEVKNLFETAKYKIKKQKRTVEEQLIYEAQLQSNAKFLPFAVDSLKYSEKQSNTAKKPRPIKNYDGETLDDVIQKLSKQKDEKPSELWPHLLTAIEEWSGNDCREIRSSNGKRDSWSYRFERGNGEVDSITYQSFRKKISEFRSGN